MEGIQNDVRIDVLSSRCTSEILNEKKIFYISFTSRGGGASQGDE
jgi:hypothetical protein